MLVEARQCQNKMLHRWDFWPRENEQQQRARKTFEMSKLHMPTDEDNHGKGKGIHQVLN